MNDRISEFGVADTAVKFRYEHVLRGFTAKLTDEQLEALKNDDRVKYVEQDFRFKAASSAPGVMPKPLNNNSALMSQTIPWGIARVEGPFNGSGKKAWILDTGIDLNHDDLNVDQTNSISYVSTEPSPDDLHGHGTHVAGVLAAKDNNSHTVGVAAAATVVSVKVLNQNLIGTVSNVVAGVNYASNNAISNHVINMSLNGPTSSSIDDAVKSAASNGRRIIIAAGNQADNANNYSPSRVERNNVWTVSAFDDTDTFASFSNFGNPPIEFGGPGVNVLSLAPGNNITFRSGTSFATPHIAGLLLAIPDGIGSDDVVSGDPDGNPDPIAEAVLIAPITGSSILPSGQQGNWQANAKYGESSYSYQWFYRNNTYDPWITGSTSSSFSHTFVNTGNYANNAAVKVEVTSGSEVVETIKNVLVQPDCASGGIISC